MPNGDDGRLPNLAADLVERTVDAIVAEITVATQMAKSATSTIPIVMAVVADPVRSGRVPNLAQPSRNVTGLSIMLAELSVKRLPLVEDTISDPQPPRCRVECGDPVARRQSTPSNGPRARWRSISALQPCERLRRSHPRSRWSDERGRSSASWRRTGTLGRTPRDDAGRSTAARSAG